MRSWRREGNDLVSGLLRELNGRYDLGWRVDGLIYKSLGYEDGAICVNIEEVADALHWSC